jgi:hypothetical protein
MSLRHQTKQEIGDMNISEIITELRRFSGETIVTLKYNHQEENWGDLDSYRGYYSELAVDTGDTKVDVAHVIKALDEAVGLTFTGYKGGEYMMSGNTDLYWAEYGCLGPVASKVYMRYGEVYIEFEEDR